MDLGDPTLLPIKVMGVGSFGKVFLCKYRGTQKVCVKRIIVNNPKSEMSIIMGEIYIISQLRHPNIIQFIRSFVHASTVNIVMEYAPRGTLQVLIKQAKSGFNTKEILRYFCDILMGLEYLHIRHVFHRDLKPENILVDANNHLKITDFGISLIYSPTITNSGTGCTPFYAAPEVLRSEKYEYKSDIWSLGCILYEMCMGYSPFSQAKDTHELTYLVKVVTNPKMNCGVLRKKYGPLLPLLCERMIVYSLPKRISLPEILCLDAALTLPYYKMYFDYKY